MTNTQNEARFAVRIGQPGDATGCLLPHIFATYDEAEAEATHRRRRNTWACVQQIDGDAQEERTSAQDLTPTQWLQVQASVSNNADLDDAQRRRLVDLIGDQYAASLDAHELAGFHQFVSPETGGTFGSFELFHLEDDPSWGDVAQCDHDADHGPCEHCRERGFYWHSKFPGCLPDGDTSGPFDSAKEAWEDAQRI
jgi:hypothetical protein